MAWVRAADWWLNPPRIQCPEPSHVCIVLPHLCSEHRSTQGWGGVGGFQVGAGRSPWGFSGQPHPCSGRSSQLVSLDCRRWCLWSAEVLFWYPNPFWTYVCSITLLKYSENQIHYLLFFKWYLVLFTHFPPLNSVLHAAWDLLLAISLS